jgi:opacity protein-like surface antigen
VNLKKILLLTLFVSFAITTTAQLEKETKYGFRVGANHSTLEGDKLGDLAPRIGMHASFFAEVPLSSKLSLVPELGVSALGVNERELRLPTGDIVESKTNWLQVTLLAKINLSQKLYLQLGPQAGVNVTEKDDNDLYNYDFSAVGGLGYKFNQNLGVDVRYGYGLSNVYDNAFEVDNKAMNRYFQLGLSYRL